MQSDFGKGKAVRIESGGFYERICLKHALN